MRFTITRENLQQGLGAVAGSIPSRTTLPVLSNILIEAEDGAVRMSGTDLDTAVSDRGEARAAIQTARAELERAALDLEFTKVTAPIAGRVGAAQVTKGNLVSPGETLLTTIVSLDPIYLYFDVDERALLAYQKASVGGGDVKTANLKVSAGLANEDGFPHEGVVDFVDNRVDAGTGTIRVRAVFPNGNRAFTPGLFGVGT